MQVFLRVGPQDATVNANTIEGVTIGQPGEAKGHGFHVESSFLEKLMRLGNESQKGIKVRFGHPGYGKETLGTFVGRANNFRMEGDKLKATISLSEVAKKSPYGDLYSYLTGMADKEPDMLGMSVSVSPRKFYQYNKEGDKILVDDYTYDRSKQVYVDFDEFSAVDFVDAGAITPEGLFQIGDNYSETKNPILMSLKDWLKSGSKETELTVKTEELTQLRADMEAAQAELESAQEQVQSLTVARDTATTQLSAITSERDDLQAQLATLTAERDALQTRVNELSQEPGASFTDAGGADHQAGDEGKGKVIDLAAEHNQLAASLGF